MSMGPDIFLTHLLYATEGDEDLARKIYALGTVTPIVDSFTGDVIGFQFAMVARKHAASRRPTIKSSIEIHQ